MKQLPGGPECSLLGTPSLKECPWRQDDACHRQWVRKSRSPLFKDPLSGLARGEQLELAEILNDGKERVVRDRLHLDEQKTKTVNWTGQEQHVRLDVVGSAAIWILGQRYRVETVDQRRTEADSRHRRLIQLKDLTLELVL